MNYRHIFHAGSCSDVVKHTVLLLLLNALKLKDKGFCYIDTHAGCGMYDLTSEQANKTAEYKQGIAALTGNYKNPIIQQFLNLVATVGANHYPGSPWFARESVREQDKIILNELHPDDYQTLVDLFYYDKAVSVHKRDAYEFLPAMLPPQLKRGLVLIDPPFEDFSEKQKLVEALEKCHKKWAQGVYMIWLPLKEESLQSFYKNITNIPFKNHFTLKFFWKPTPIKANALIGCSIIILNLPFSAKENLVQLLADLKVALSAIGADFEWDFQEKN